MPIVAWYLLAVSPAIALLLLDGGRMLMQRRARRRLTAASLDHALTVRRIEVAKTEALGTLDALRADVTASDYGYRSETPTFDSVCADVARREAAELDVEWEREAGA